MGIGIFKTKDPVILKQVYEFRLRIFRDEVKALFPKAVLASKELRDEFDEVAYQYVAMENDKVIGCARAFDLADVPRSEPLLSRYQLDRAMTQFPSNEIAFTGRLLVASGYRASRTAVKLMSRATADGRRRGVRIAFLDCSPRLLPFYEAFGFRRYGKPFNDPIYGFKIPLVFLVKDKVTLKACHSPLADGSYEDDKEARDWYNETSFRQNMNFNRRRSTQVLSKYLGDNLARVELFSCFSHPQIDLILRRATVIQAYPEQILLQNGLRDNVLLVVIEGQLKTEHDVNGRPVECMLNIGQHAGQLRFCGATLDVTKLVATRPSTLLVICAETLQWLAAKHADIATKISRILSESPFCQKTSPYKRHASC